jgi:hypothetical protein
LRDGEKAPAAPGGGDVDFSPTSQGCLIVRDGAVVPLKPVAGHIGQVQLAGADLERGASTGWAQSCHYSQCLVGVTRSRWPEISGYRWEDIGMPATPVTRPGDGPTAVFLSENGGTYPW